MKRLKNNQGFTLIELMVVCMIPVILFGVLVLGFGVVKGNFWVQEDSALKAIKFEDPSISEVLVIERHIWGKSKATVVDEEGNRRVFLLDSNIMQNITARPLVEV